MQIVKVEPLAGTNVVLRIRANEGRQLEYNIDGLRTRGWLGERSIAPRENTRARTPHYLLNHRVAAKSQAAAPLGNSFCLNTAEAGLKIALPSPPRLASLLPLRARRVHYAK